MGRQPDSHSNLLAVREFNQQTGSQLGFTNREGDLLPKQWVEAAAAYRP